MTICPLTLGSLERALAVQLVGWSLAWFCAHSLTWKNVVRAEKDGK